MTRSSGSVIDPLTGEVLNPPSVDVVPASHYVIPEERLSQACAAIEEEAAERLAELRRRNCCWRLNGWSSTRYDLRCS